MTSIWRRLMRSIWCSDCWKTCAYSFSYYTSIGHTAFFVVRRVIIRNSYPILLIINSNCCSLTMQPLSQPGNQLPIVKRYSSKSSTCTSSSKVWQIKIPPISITAHERNNKRNLILSHFSPFATVVRTQYSSSPSLKSSFKYVCEREAEKKREPRMHKARSICMLAAVWQINFHAGFVHTLVSHYLNMYTNFDWYHTSDGIPESVELFHEYSLEKHANPHVRCVLIRAPDRPIEQLKDLRRTTSVRLRRIPKRSHRG